MAEIDTEYIWTRISELATPIDAPGVPSPFKPKTAEELKKRRKLKSYIWVLDLVSTLAWSYAFLKLFVVDVDRWIVDRVVPSLSWMVDFRFFLLLGGLAIVLVIFRKPSAAWPFAYISLFPLVILVWKIPRMIFRLKSGVAALGALHVIFGVAGGLRRTIIGVAIFSLAAFSIALGGPNLVSFGMVVASMLLLAWLYLAIRSALRPAKFITRQQKFISKIVGSKFLANAIGPQQKVDKASVESWTSTEASSFVATLSLGVVAYRAAHYWAYSLDAYRRSAASVVFSALTVLGLFAQVAIIFGLLNLGLHRIDGTQFAFSNEPTYWTFLYYSFTGSFFGEISALTPVATMAFVLKIANGILGSVVVLTLISAVILGARQTKTDEVSRQAIRDLKTRADVFGTGLGTVYGDTSVEDLEQRLSAFKFAFSGVLEWLIRQAPKDWAPR